MAAQDFTDRLRRRANFVAVTGTSIAFYDFFLYNAAILLVFAPALAGSGASSQWLIGASQFVGFAARPLGAVLFSRFGDRIGRKSALIWTLVTMGVPTAVIGIVPLGWGLGTIILLTVIRLLQGVGLGGEWAGAALLALEWEPERDRRAFAASLAQLGVPIGLVLGTLLLSGFRLLLPADQFSLWGWRAPFLLSVPLVLFALRMRLGVLDTPVFTELAEEHELDERPVLHALERYPRQIALSALVRASADIGFYVFVMFAAVYVTRRYGQGRPALMDQLTNRMMAAVLLGSLAAVLCVPSAGWVADRLGRKGVYYAGIIGLAVYAWPFFLLLDTRDPGVTIAAMVLALVLHSIQFGPQAALIAEAFPPEVRYSGASLGYQLAPVVAGAWAVPIATLLLQRFDSPAPIALYMIGYCGISAIALRFLPARPYQYEVALSYAGEDREYVDRVAAALKRRGVSLFYDRYEEAGMWGRDLRKHLRAVYGKQSRFVVLFVSEHYAAKIWTRHELRSAQVEEIRRKGEAYLLPARLDDTDVPGLNPMIAYVDCRRTTPEALASLIVEKISRRH